MLSIASNGSYCIPAIIFFLPHSYFFKNNSCIFKINFTAVFINYLYTLIINIFNNSIIEYYISMLFNITSLNESNRHLQRRYGNNLFLSRSNKVYNYESYKKFNNWTDEGNDKNRNTRKSYILIKKSYSYIHSTLAVF